MHTPLFRRGIGLMLTLATLLSLGLTAHGAEENSLCAKHPQHTAECGYEATGKCSHTHSVESGCLIHKCSHTHEATCYDTSGNENCPHDCETTPECYTLMIALKGTDVVLPDGTEYTYTGEEIRPAVTVTVNQEVLKEKEHYTLTYSDNVEPGTGKVVVSGIATAGFEGAIEMSFTIVKAEAPTEPEQPSEETKPEEKPFEYKITKGSGSKWRKESGKNLSFTVNADVNDITAIAVNGKKLDKANYTLGKDGLVTLKNGYLEKLDIGNYTITMAFDDGKAEGKFTVAKALDPTNPATGDSILLWVAILGLSAAGVVTLIFLKKRKA